MSGMSGIGPLVWQRLLASWRLLSVLAFGVLIAATLLAASPVYTRVMNDLGLKASLQDVLRNASGNGGSQFGLPLGSPEAAKSARSLTTILSEEIGWFTQGEARYGRLPRFTLGRAGEPLRTDMLRPLLELQTLSDFDDKVNVVAGRLPQPTSDPRNLEAVIPAEAAGVIGLQPGGQLYVAQSFDDCNRPPPTSDPEELRERARFPCLPQASVTLTAQFTVVGLVSPKDPDDIFWSAGAFNFQRPQFTEEEGPTIQALFPEQTFFQALPQLLPGISTEFRLTGFANVDRLNSANLEEARASLARLDQRLDAQGAVADLGMDEPLRTFQGRAAFNQVPLLLLLIQVVGIAIYYVLLVASLLAEQRAEEIAMLRSRGASIGQIVLLSAAEAAVLIAGSVLVAPFLASGVVAALGKTGTFESISGGDFLAYTLVPQSFLFALAGATLAGLAIIVPAFFAARRSMVGFLLVAARPDQPLMQRYYLDVGLVGLAALGIWQMNQQGSVFDPESIGGWSADPLVLLSPFLLIMAVGAVMFRFLPLVLRVISRIVATTAGPGLTLGLWQLTRSPARYTQLALLVVMAAAVGTFAATYSETTERSQEERALYQAGADVRLTGLGRLDGLRPAQVRQELGAIEGVEAVATANRMQLRLGPLAGLGPTIQVLAVDPEEAASVVWFRDDFANEGVEALLRRLIGFQTVEKGLFLPGEPVALSLWANPSEARPGTTLWARTIDGAGAFRLHELANLGFEGGYRRFETRLPSEQDGLVYPVSLVSLLMTQGAGSAESTRATLLIDEISVTDSSGGETVVESFEGPFRWDALRTGTRTRDAVAQVRQVAQAGSGAARFSFQTGTGVGIRGLYVRDPNLPVPAIASAAFLQNTGLQPGGEVELVLGSLILPVTIQGAVSLFPSLGGGDAGFLIVSQEHLHHFAGLINQDMGGTRSPNEAWLTLTKDEETRESVFQTLRDKYSIFPSVTIDTKELITELGADPVVRAGGSGVLLISILAAFSILALGFGLTLYLGGQSRTIEVSVMRAVGLSPRQVFVMISFEYLFVAVIGLLIGTLAGLRISETMLSFLNVTEDGTPVIPPFSLSTRWDTVAIAFAATAAAFLLGIGALALYFLRLQMSRILRLTR